MSKKKIAFILGIRPDIIRASLIIRLLKKEKKVETVFIWSGQHYSDNLKDVFFRELDVKKPDIELGCGGESDAEIVSNLILKLYQVLNDLKPDTAVFLGDTNTVLGCIAAAQLNIPIVHIEGCMRSYDWRMPEEKNRTIVDHLSDLIYVYLSEYREQGIREGLNPNNIIVSGNPIVDVLNKFYFGQKDKFDKLAQDYFLANKNIIRKKYYLMTCHRRENVQDRKSLEAIFNLVAFFKHKIYYPASYRTQKMIKEFEITLPKNLIMTDPIGYREFILLLTNSRGVLTDSGTVVEEACILNIPSIQMRKSTERPQVYDVGSSVKFDPTDSIKYPPNLILRKFDKLTNRKWKHNFGDGKTSEIITKDLINRLINNGIQRHFPEMYHLPTERSYREDGLK